ncbi:hypothetical protein QEO94_11265 [Kingella negevensis]|uniref:hypothetical protein n=1 Tax=Kingella negevensis TaxID=1522312 RepID=UPI002543167F|nr:hypothetical protein [Kingella negevensis]WII93178.1 hypothetical protein QEO94_11265 [Kingella negevensis]
MKNIDIALAKILETGLHTPEEIQTLLAEQGYQIDLDKLTKHLNLMISLGEVRKMDTQYTTRSFN